MSRCLPSRCAMKALTEETVHEARHRQATTFGLMEDRSDKGTRDDRLVTGSLCHQGSMPQEWGLLQNEAPVPMYGPQEPASRRKRGIFTSSCGLPNLHRPALFLNPQQPRSVILCCKTEVCSQIALAITNFRESLLVISAHGRSLIPNASIPQREYSMPPRITYPARRSSSCCHRRRLGWPATILQGFDPGDRLGHRYAG